MDKISILDCTLREGGYVNNWDFGYENISKIINNLTEANLEYIECGFLKETSYNTNLSLFSDIFQLKKIISKSSSTIYTLMINYGEYDFSKLPKNTDGDIAIRVAFKKHEIKGAFEFCKNIQDKRYKVFVNPMHIYSYSESELERIIELTNILSPYSFTIVDTTGAMKEKDILSVTKIIKNRLDSKIKVSFHSHNNLQLSLSNAQYLIKLLPNRDLIIDSTIYGMGRGAGNLYTEIIAQYFNDNYNGIYNTSIIFNLFDDVIKPIYEKTPWGYSVPYHIAAENNCHPYYAKFLINKKNISIEMINSILKQIPENKKTTYDAQFIENMYIQNCSGVLTKGTV